jgi:diacylglycerol kinase family enzyme
LFFLRAPAKALVPSLKVNDDGLHALVFHNLTIFGFVRTLWDLYLLQSTSTKHMTHLSSAETVEIEAHPSWNLHLDGDFIPLEPGQRTHTLAVVKNAVNILC